MTTTATRLVHTSSREADNAVRIARVAAAGRVQAARVAAEARREAGLAQNLATAQAWVDQITAAGAVTVGFKVCFAEGGKWRPRFDVADAAQSIARWVFDGDEVEAWGLDATGEYVGEVLSVW